MPALTLEHARLIVETALRQDRSDPGRRVAVCVVDAGGHALVVQREADAPPLLAHIAEAKAQSCIVYGKPTKTIMEWADETPIWFQGVRNVSAARMGLPLIGSLGGVIIRNAEGAVIGACGVAGEVGAYDEAFAVAGITAAGLTAETG